MVKLKSDCGLNKTHFWLHFFLAFLNVVLYSTVKKLNPSKREVFKFQVLWGSTGAENFKPHRGVQLRFKR